MEKYKVTPKEINKPDTSDFPYDSVDIALNQTIENLKLEKGQWILVNLIVKLLVVHSIHTVVVGDSHATIILEMKYSLAC